MANEEQKLVEKKRKVSRELQRRREQVEQEKRKLDDVNQKLTKCKNHQELHEKNEEKLKEKLISICQVSC